MIKKEDPVKKPQMPTKIKISITKSPVRSKSPARK
jgi:hypothetical protein